jgi:hypothetical protein
MRGGPDQVRRFARTSLITYMFEIAVDVGELDNDGRNNDLLLKTPQQIAKYLERMLTARRYDNEETI